MLAMIFANEESLRMLQYEAVQQNEIKLIVVMLLLQGGSGEWKQFCTQT